MYKILVTALMLAGLSSPALADDRHDTDDNDRAEHAFGFKPIKDPSTVSIDIATANANPLALLKLAHGLKAEVVSAELNLGANIDMMTLWPNDVHPTHIIACNEQGAAQPGVQRISLANGSVETILTGTVSCDPAHTTPWGTVIVAEENGANGSMLEIIDPLHTTGVQYNNVTHALTGADAGNVAYRPAVGHLSFEGVYIYPNGVMYYGDENRPTNGTAGGAYFKFIPAALWNSGAAPITALNQSPLVAGTVYGLRLGKRGQGDFTTSASLNPGNDNGQGTNTGRGAWIQIPGSDVNLRAAAAANNLTGYYRPEDLQADLKAEAAGMVRFCGVNTGNEGEDKNWGEVICVTDGTIAQAAVNGAVPEVQPFVMGSFEMAMMDNIAYQPGRGNWVVQEDRDAVGMTGGPYPFNNSIYMCKEDGPDVDTMSDGCARFVTLNDLNAETTGGLFDGFGKAYYFSVQHNVTGHGVIVKVTGWK